MLYCRSIDPYRIFLLAFGEVGELCLLRARTTAVLATLEYAYSMHMQYELVVHIHVRWLDLLSRRVLASSLVSVGRDPHVSTTIKNLNL